ncbi:MAG: ATP-binding protein [Casimicrobiaceae bacterium]|nr:ATP-binding protein [Casimicrobiaceae bacterium]MCX8099012.1 ATP-binding protein [Casimicrobiaceae bacterium]MDW8311460.1 ATP-binding protein [Burkholderiales bacterium]
MTAQDTPVPASIAPPRWLRIAWLVFALAGAALVAVLAQASVNSTLLTRYYTALLIASALIVLALAALVLYQLVLLLRARRARVFGAVLTARMMGFFVVVAALPGVLVYAISVRFLSSTIESYFDTRIERALEAGLQLGKHALSEPLKELARRGEAMAEQLAEAEDLTAARTRLIALRERYRLPYAALLTQTGTTLGVASERSEEAIAPTLGSFDLRQVRPLAPLTAIEPLSDGGLQLRVAVAVPGTRLQPQRVLLLLQPVPAALRERTAWVDAGFRDYQELAFQRTALKRLFALMLTLTLLLAVFAALALAALFSDRLARPMAALAQATRKVAEGDFSARAPASGEDELAVLGSSFNRMTEELAEARQREASHQKTIETNNLFLENILRNIKTGVLVLSDDYRLSLANAAASVILQARLDEAVGRQLTSATEVAGAVAEFAQQIERGFARSQDGDWQRELVLEVGGLSRTLIVRAARRSIPGGAARLIVFDDLTEVLSAQRDMAWAEVARRLAHEIKNPLTPIQLSAERLQVKLTPLLGPAEAETLSRATSMIINQVTAMKNMVNDFAVYARQPRPGSLVPVDVEALLRETLDLYGAHPIQIVLDWRAEPRFIRAEATRLRQVFHNLITNAAEACAEQADARLEIVATVRTKEGPETGAELVLQFCDNGGGFPRRVLDRVFEPYVTTKAKGTGLGLAIVKKIVDEHHGSIDIENLRDASGAVVGARVTLAFPVYLLHGSS